MDLIYGLARGKKGQFIDKHYNFFLEKSATKGWTGTIMMFMEVALEYAQLGRVERAVEVLRDMTKNGHQPTDQDISRLLLYSLVSGESKLLCVIANWYLTNFEAKLLRGELKRLIHIASAIGDNELAVISLQLMEKYGWELGYSDLVSLIRACILAEDFGGVIEMLFEAEKRGFDLYQVRFALKHMLHAVDNIYYEYIHPLCEEDV